MGSNNRSTLYINNLTPTNQFHANNTIARFLMCYQTGYSVVLFHIFRPVENGIDSNVTDAAKPSTHSGDPGVLLVLSGVTLS